MMMERLDIQKCEVEAFFWKNPFRVDPPPFDHRSRLQRREYVTQHKPMVVCLRDRGGDRRLMVLPASGTLLLVDLDVM
jgi:hypothetical protein